MLFIGLFCFGYGQLALFARDKLWDWEEHSRWMKGRQLKRTLTWDAITIISGVGLAFVGLVALYVAFNGE
jgi:hypothetical protein